MGWKNPKQASADVTEWAKEKRSKLREVGSGHITQDFVSNVKEFIFYVKYHGKLVEGFNRGSDLP